MKCFFTFALAAALAAALNTTTWSQTGGGGGAGGASGGAGSGSAGTSAEAGTTGAAGTTGTTGSTGTATSAGAASNAAGVTGTAGAAGATNRAGAAGNAGINANGTPGLGRGAAVNGTARAGANVGRTNAAGQVGINNAPFSSIRQTPFFSDPNVQRQLNLNTNQFSTLNTAYQNAFNRFNQAVTNLNNNPNLTPEQRAMQLQQLEAQFNQNFGVSLNTAFPNVQARSRFDQLNRQFMGFNAFNDPAIRRELNLTPEQASQLRALANDWRQQFQQFRRGAGNNLNNLSAQDQVAWNQLRNGFMTQLNGVLTPEQQQIWSRMVGQPFAFPPSVFVGSTGSGSGTFQNPVPVPTTSTEPKYFPQGTTGQTTTPTQGTTGQRQATTQGTTPTQGAQGGTVR